MTETIEELRKLLNKLRDGFYQDVRKLQKDLTEVRACACEMDSTGSRRVNTRAQRTTLFCSVTERTGAAAIVMAFDEVGQADNYERRIEIAKRSLCRALVRI